MGPDGAPKVGYPKMISLGTRCGAVPNLVTTSGPFSMPHESIMATSGRNKDPAERRLRMEDSQRHLLKYNPGQSGAWSDTKHGAKTQTTRILMNMFVMSEINFLDVQGWK